MSIADSQQIGTNCKGYSFAFIDKGNSLACCDVDRAVDAVDDIQRPNLRIDKYLGILAANYS